MRTKIKLDKVNGKLESGKAGELLSTLFIDQFFKIIIPLKDMKSSSFWFQL